MDSLRDFDTIMVHSYTYDITGHDGSPLHHNELTGIRKQNTVSSIMTDCIHWPLFSIQSSDNVQMIKVFDNMAG